jgi:outer membrane protein assembly factor BamB
MHHHQRWLAAALCLILPVALCGLACLVSPAGEAKQRRPLASAWPMFGGTPARNMVNPFAKDVPTEWSVENGKLEGVKWVAKLGSVTITSPVVAGGRVFVGTNNANPRDPKVAGKKAVLMCFNEADGKFLWQAVHDLPPKEISRDAFEAGYGLCSTPTVEGDRIYYVTPACVVVCADVKTGTSHWQVDMMKDYGVFPCYVAVSSPLVAGDLVFVVTGNGKDDRKDVLVAPMAPSFAAFHKKDGKLAWKNNLPGKGIIEGQWSNPAYAVVNGKPQVIFPGGDTYLYGLEPETGKMIWKFNCNIKPAVGGGGRKKTMPYFLATPVVYDNKVYVGTGLYADHPSGNREGHFWCVRLDKTGDASPVNGNLDPKAPENKDSALVWHFGGPMNPRPKLGRQDVFERTMSTAAIHDGLVYITEMAGFLHCLDAATGKKYWEHDFKTDIEGSPFWADGKIYVGTDDQDVVILAHGKKEKVLATINMDEKAQTAPVAVSGVLYVTTPTKLYSIGKK